ncbi:MAG: 23S rRNA (adenine(2503)-C(2))-methyltransferase RlmN [Trueperaceae bacterium]
MNLLDLESHTLPFPDAAKYRQKQLGDWLYTQGARSFEAMSNLPKAWREDLKMHYQLDPFTRVQRFPSDDKSVRYLFTLQDGKQTEAVYMPYKDRKTVCLSSMVGCPAGCAFCATGALGFGRNLTKAEILGQLLAVAWEEKFPPKDIRNVVMMGMGEALLNYDHALGAMKTMIDPAALDMSARRITLSTVGLPQRIRRLADEELPLVLAVSLHAPDDETRRQIIPTAQAYPVAEIMDSLHYWQEQGGRRITLEYTMLEGVNDHIWQADMLAGLVKNLDAHINLIPFNAWHNSGFKTSSRKTIEAFQKVLERAGLSVSVRFSRGQDAGGACGQLSLQGGEKSNQV